MRRFVTCVVPVVLLAGCPRQQPETYPEEGEREEIEPEEVMLRDIARRPAAFIGDEVEFETAFRVVSVPSDRGFWIEQQGEQMFVVVVDEPFEEAVDITPGQMIWIDEAEVHDASYLDDVEDEISAQSRQIASRLAVWLLVEEDDIRVVGSGMRRPGT